MLIYLMFAADVYIHCICYYHKTISLKQEIIEYLKQTYPGSILNFDQNKRILQQKYLPSNTMAKSSGFSMIKREFDKLYFDGKINPIITKTKSVQVSWNWKKKFCFFDCFSAEHNFVNVLFYRKVRDMIFKNFWSKKEMLHSHLLALQQL